MKCREDTVKIFRFASLQIIEVEGREQ